MKCGMIFYSAKGTVQQKEQWEYGLEGQTSVGKDRKGKGRYGKDFPKFLIPEYKITPPPSLARPHF